jgi:hypothetical protein
MGTGCALRDGVYNVMRNGGPSGAPLIVPTTRLITAAPARAPGSVSATFQVTFGALAGMRP